MVRNNLPPDSMAWGRDIDTRLRELELLASNLHTAVVSNDARLTGISKSLNDLAATQTQLSATITTLNNQQTQINNQVAFLATQTEFLTGDNIRGWTSPSDGSSYDFPFDPLQDIAGTFTTSSTGRIIATLSSKAQIINPAGKSGAISVYVNFQKGSTTDSEGLWLASAPSEGEWQFNFSGATRNFDLDPNSTYTVTSEVSFAGDENTWFSTGPLFLQITKLGM